MPGRHLVIVLDTHVLIWWVNDRKQLSLTGKRAINKALKRGEEILISSISAWEITMLVKKDRLTLTMDVNDWIITTAAIEGVRYIPVDNIVAMQSVVLPGEFHADPADRMIVALARHYSAPLVTADKRILTYEHVKTIW
jgi:PIN domain nuclease of toxin-antitoxin system